MKKILPYFPLMLGMLTASSASTFVYGKKIALKVPQSQESQEQVEIGQPVIIDPGLDISKFDAEVADVHSATFSEQLLWESRNWPEWREFPWPEAFPYFYDQDVLTAHEYLEQTAGGGWEKYTAIS